MVVDGDQVEHVLLGLAVVPRPRAPRARCSSTARRSARRPRAQIAGRARRARPDVDRRAGHRLVAEGRGRHADDHGRRRPARTSSAIEPLLEAMGELIVHAGPLGHGQMVKLINNAVAAANATVVGQALLVGCEGGCSISTRSSTVLGAGAGGSTMLGAQVRADARARLLDPVQARAHAQGRAACASTRAGPRASRSRPRPSPARCCVAAMGRGHADDDFAALIEALEGLAGIRL